MLPRLVCIAAALLPLAAYGSFGGGTPCKDFACYFLFWGVILGVAGGIPVSCLVFVGLHVFFCHPERSKAKQALLGVFLGIVAFGVAGACAALTASLAPATNPFISLGAALAVLAILSVLYVRSSPSGAS